ncbi:hypothetical protein B296_00024525 [Ensete ventricosum]|uniref:Uncharacterized protein n=1 Tax=Ensete ventricosum TaxID=4639 RepID=A0A426XK41_ENSVE|nr:hypothetical protein B296_00024525 [Ensete ventricosum]
MWVKGTLGRSSSSKSGWETAWLPQPPRLVEGGPCVLVCPRSSRDRVGARLDGWIPRTPSRGLAARVVELRCMSLYSGCCRSSVPETLLPLWLTMPSYTSTTPAVLAVRHVSTGKGVNLTCVRSVVRPLGIRPYLCQVILAVRHASTGEGVDLTCVRSVVRPLAPPYLCPTSFPHRVDHVDGPVVRGREDVVAMSSFALSWGITYHMHTSHFLTAATC